MEAKMHDLYPLVGGRLFLEGSVNSEAQELRREGAKTPSALP
jgi:hypothetical protein